MRRLLVATLTVCLLAGCGSDQDNYCEAIEDHQRALGELFGSSDPDALLQAHEILRELEDQAPSDIADEWRTLNDAITGLRDTIEATGADPETYDPHDPPPEVTREEQQAIRAASRRMTSPETLAALLAVDQQVRDVCHTPLNL